MPCDALLKAPEAALSFLKFPELCREAYPKSLVTLAKLEILDFANYIECLDRIDLHGIPENVIKLSYNFGDFMIWLEDHVSFNRPVIAPDISIYSSLSSVLVRFMSMSMTAASAYDSYLDLTYSYDLLHYPAFTIHSKTVLHKQKST